MVIVFISKSYYVIEKSERPLIYDKDLVIDLQVSHSMHGPHNINYTETGYYTFNTHGPVMLRPCYYRLHMNIF